MAAIFSSVCDKLCLFSDCRCQSVKPWIVFLSFGHRKHSSGDISRILQVVVIVMQFSMAADYRWSTIWHHHYRRQAICSSCFLPALGQIVCRNFENFENGVRKQMTAEHGLIEFIKTGCIYSLYRGTNPSWFRITPMVYPDLPFVSNVLHPGSCPNRFCFGLSWFRETAS